MRNKTNTFVFALSAALMFYATGVNSQEANEPTLQLEGKYCNDVFV